MGLQELECESVAYHGAGYGPVEGVIGLLWKRQLDMGLHRAGDLVHLNSKLKTVTLLLLQSLFSSTRMPMKWVLLPQDADIRFNHLSFRLLIFCFHVVVFLCDFFLLFAVSFEILYPFLLSSFLSSFVVKPYYLFLLTPFFNFTFLFTISKFSEFTIFCCPYLYSSFPPYILLYSRLLTTLPFQHSSLLLHVTCKQKLMSIVNPIKAAIHFLH
jgi:hypothetical protein